MNKPKLNKVSVSFTQEGNTLGTTSDYENIEIILEFPLDEEDGPFYVIKTKGWSFDDIDELKKLIKRVEKILEK